MVRLFAKKSYHPRIRLKPNLWLPIREVVFISSFHHSRFIFLPNKIGESPSPGLTSGFVLKRSEISPKNLKMSLATRVSQFLLYRCFRLIIYSKFFRTLMNQYTGTQGQSYKNKIEKLQQSRQEKGIPKISAGKMGGEEGRGCRGFGRRKEKPNHK